MEFFISADVRIGNNHKASFCICNDIVHSHHVLHTEVFVIEFSVLIFLSVFNIEPEHINWERVVIEGMTALYNIVSSCVFIFRVVESKTMDWWHFEIACEF